ncbi:uncharacterized protein ZBAI_02621 [Zygosaccharomyces bailii ISA1307]|nr:uncharacterized protein ZBAI_02621 [Zygosaccharomyces bailii ISA1307]
MGLCSSKADRPSTTATATQSTVTQRTAPPKRAAPTPKPVPKTQAQTKSKQKHYQKTKKKSHTSPKRPDASKSSPSRGHTVSDMADANREKLSPQEAARLAAEKRFQESNEKSTRGELGRKLAQERAKSAKTHVLQDVEQRKAEKDNSALIYD